VAVLSVAAVGAWYAGRRAGLWPARLSPLVPAATLLLGVYVALTAWQVRVWHNSYWLWEYTLQVTEDNWIAHCHRGKILARDGRDEEAATEYRAALNLDSRDVDSLIGLGTIRARQGRLDEAVRYFADAHHVSPSRLLVLDSWAAALAQPARQATDDRMAHYLDQLASAYADAGAFDRAVATAQQALALAAEQPDLAHEIEARLRLFEAGQPFRAKP
jgi:tetratricopeptide (TPR) repeat protein